MCGIVGIVSDNLSQYIDQANAEINHRGPDDRGIFKHKNLSLGHQRLSILDLSINGHQPMLSQDGRYVLIYNGEIYNHLELRREYLKGHSFKSTSDTETLLNLFIKEGESSFSKLNGIFAFCIFDKHKEELIICRDQLGIKPLYYYLKDENFFFGSEIKSFLKIPEWNKSIDFSALQNYIHFLWSPGDKTPFKYVRKLKPGHYLKMNIKKISDAKHQKYYDIPFNGERLNLNESQWIDQVENSLIAAIEKQLLSDVPVGFFLSGGLDSSLIVAIAKKITNKKLPCYTIKSTLKSKDDDGFTNDYYYARKVATELGVELHDVGGEVDILSDFDKMIWHLDEPQADPAPINVYNISKLARKNGHYVLLGGAGGDDLFSGYRRHQALHFEKYIKHLPFPIRSGLKSISSTLPNNKPLFRRIRKLLKHVNESQVDRLAGYYEWLSPKISRSLFNKDILHIINDHNPAETLFHSRENIKNENDLLNLLLYWDMKYFLTDHNLNYTDKMSMALGVEARVPYLDVDLVNLSTKIPSDLKLKGNTTKYILKKVAERHLPKDVIYRPKTGFGAPVRKWIISDLDEMVNDYLSEDSINKRGIFNYKNISNLIINNKKGKVDASYSIWSLLAIESWMRQFVDN